MNPVSCAPRWSALLIALGAAGLDGADAQPTEELPEISMLANPFVFADGTPVRSPDAWARRRQELKRLFEHYEYGTLPPKPERMELHAAKPLRAEARGVVHHDLTLRLFQAGRQFDLHVRLDVPVTATGRLPVVIECGYGGYPVPAPPLPSWFPPEPDGPSVYTKGGYATATFLYSDAAEDDREAARHSGIYRLFGGDLDTGALMAWAWAIHRVVDALETLPQVDATRIVVSGLSRFGKAALVAGAFDERIAITVPHHSGTAGASPFRFIYGKAEHLHNIAGYAPHWFCPRFLEFVGHVDRLPVDQHLLKALVAPRALLSTEGTDDEWSNPRGSQLTYRAAREVYRFLGVPDRISIRFRPVGHIPSPEDLVAFADHVFWGKPLPSEFGQLPYPLETDGFPWTAPSASH